jgi:hypothetical protein
MVANGDIEGIRDIFSASAADIDSPTLSVSLAIAMVVTGKEELFCLLISYGAVRATKNKVH